MKLDPTPENDASDLQVIRNDREESVEYSGVPDACDFCGRPLHDEGFFADALLPGHRQTWGILCHVCTLTNHVRAGWGIAQFYERREAKNKWQGANASRWVCVAGLPPSDPKARDGSIPSAHHSGAMSCG